jgi:hypothetical protein
MRHTRLRAAAAAGLVAALAAPPVAAPAQDAGTLVLPKAVGEIPVVAEAFADRPERLRRSQVPGRVDDTERVEVAVGPDGTPAAVAVRQRLVLHGTGQFVVWQRSSARDAEPLDDTDPPVLKREAVIWQGFVRERKELAALLTLDPTIEAERLPVAVALEWRGAGALGAGGAVPGPGELVVRLRNRTSRPGAVPTGDVAPADLAGPLDALLRSATSRRVGPPPSAGRGLPETLPARNVGQRDVHTVAPLRVTGGITVTGPNVTADGPGSASAPGGLAVDGVLHGDAEFVLKVDGPGTLALDLTATPALDPRLLQPLHGGPTWRDWLRTRPTEQAVRTAVTTLVDAAASAARADEYQPYLGHHAPGRVATTYHLSVAPPEVVRAVRKPLRPKPLPIALASVALLAVVANGTALWRRL